MLPLTRSDNPARRDANLLAVLLFIALGSAAAAAGVNSADDLQFTKVQLVGANQLELSPGPENALKYRGEERDLEPPPYTLEGNTLRLGVTADGREARDIQFKLVVSRLEELAVVGPGEAFVRPLKAGDLVISLDGSGAIRLHDISASTLELQLVGSGDLQAARVESPQTRLQVNGSGDLQLGALQADLLKVHLAGSGDISIDEDSAAQALQVRLLGSGDVALERLTAEDANVTIMGSGDVKVRVLRQLEAELMGSGDLLYSGKPAVSKSSLGSGDIRQLD